MVIKSSDKPINSIHGLRKGLTTSLNHILIDLDETIFNPLYNWQLFVQEALSVHFTVKDIEMAGSMDNYFLNTPLYDEFVLVAEKLRKNDTLYKNVPLVDGALAAVKQLNRHSKLKILGYLSARPLGVLDATIEEITNHNLPLVPIILRNNETNFYSSVEWKIQVVTQVLDLCETKLIIIDDNHEFMTSLRSKFAHNKDIICIYFKGPLSNRTIGKNEILSNENENFFIADWTEIPAICFNTVQSLQVK
ncbi:MAG: hypothetical protein HF982_15120 [Desulfobacteraceae bacterium]|nr:hypothetical protein [Desulfobacteraceae bacterium]MBC2720887.1 hypothetical protein [Desulfobacteraceae bacterium]